MSRRNVGLALVYEEAPSATLDYDTSTNTGLNNFVSYVNTWFSDPRTLLDFNRNSYDAHFGDKIIV